MRHQLFAEGYGIRLRPARLDDAAFIVWLRHLEHARGRVGDSATDVTAQQAWLRAYFERPNDYYFIIETLGGIPVGTFGLYDIKNSIAEAGRWIIRPAVPAAVASLVHASSLAFDIIRLSEMYVRTVSTNRPLLSIHRKLGFEPVTLPSTVQVIGGKPVQFVFGALTAAAGLRTRERLRPLAERVAGRILAWEHAYLQQAAAVGDAAPLSGDVECELAGCARV